MASPEWGRGGVQPGAMLLFKENFQGGLKGGANPGNS